MKKLISPLSIVIVCSTLLLSGCGGNKEWREVKDSILPQLTEGNLWRRLPLLVHKEISRDLSQSYVISREHAYEFIFKYDVKDWGIDEKTLHKTAMQNLEKLAKETEMQFADAEESLVGRYVIVETGDGFDAARILSKHIQKEVRKYLGDEYIAAVPTRDFLIFWHRKFSLGGQFMEQAEKEYAKGDKYRLTPRMFLITKDGMEPLTKRPVVE